MKCHLSRRRREEACLLCVYERERERDRERGREIEREGEREREKG